MLLNVLFVVPQRRIFLMRLMFHSSITLKIPPSPTYQFKCDGPLVADDQDRTPISGSGLTGSKVCVAVAAGGTRGIDEE